MVQKMKVTYADGSEVEVVATPKAQVMTERFLRAQGGFEQSTLVEAGFRLAFESSKPGIGNVGYEEWLDKVADVDELCSDCGQVKEENKVHACPEPSGGGGLEDPTPEAPSPTPSFD